MPTPFFADLVRELAQEGGTGPLTPAGAVPGHRRFAGSVPADVSFHYAVAGIAQPGQWETGLGHLDSGGRLVRDSIAASSANGARVDFAPGLKTIALTVGADWFAASEAGRSALDAGVTALGAAMGGKQPLSTTHAEVAAGATGDLMTVRRGEAWVNVPLATISFRDGAGRYEFAGPLGAPAGSAGAPAIGFSADLDTGIFRPGNDTLGLAVGGAEAMRIAPDRHVGIGTAASPAARLHVKSSGEILRIETAAARGAGAASVRFYDASGPKGYFGYAGDDGMHLVNYLNNGILIQTNGLGLVLEANGYLRPTTDNGQACGQAGNRWSVVYSATGAINTSDARDKRWRGGASAREIAAAGRIVAELGFYQWTDAIAEKGIDGARYHFGVRAQAVWDIMADEGLCNPSSAAPCHQPYAFLCHDAWPDEVEERPGEGPVVVRDAGSRFGVRPDQLALFLIAAQGARIAQLEGEA